MRSDKFDKKIIEAANNHHPAYDGEGWKHMEELLNRHMPLQKEKKRRFVFILLLCLLLGGAGFWYYIWNFKQVHKIETTALNINAVDQLQKEKKLSGIEKSKDQNESTVQLSHSISSPIESSTVNLESELKTGIKKFPLGNKEIPLNSTSHIDSNQQKKEKNNIQENISSDTNKPVKVYVVPNNAESGETFADANPIANANDNSEIKDEMEIPDSIVKIKSALDQGKETVVIKKERAKNTKTDFFFLSLSVGPDMSFVGGNKSGAVRPSLGTGLGYTLKNGLSFRTGFYSGRKVYSASPDSYNPPPGFAQYYPILENVEADCKVYEIPVSISYNFGNSEKHNWFAGASISTLIMKKEKYTYKYKYVATGPSYYKDWTIDNGNKHIFSILTLSGGYQVQLNKTFSFIAEPYFKFPLQGVGFGKVKLNSAGIMFTLTASPFSKKTKK